MTQQGAVNGTGAPDVEAIRAEIRRTRVELGETVQALAAKADVKARVKESAAHTAAQVRDTADQAVRRARGSLAGAGRSVRERPVPWLAAAAGVTAAVVLLIVRRRRG
jgi:ElaB/YqjD/DUF883 family membrane-anchored ribosome-binding protein